MKRITLSLLIIVCLVLVISCKQKFVHTEERCNWEPGACEMLVGDGYYYDYDLNKCLYREMGSGCSSPPFSTLKECQNYCVLLK